MSILMNLNKSSYFELLSNPDKSQIFYEDDFKNWIAFSIEMSTMTEKMGYSKKDSAMMSVLEAKNIISGLKKLLLKGCDFEYYSIERYFDLIIKKCKYESDMYEAEIWFNIGTYTNGNEYGYDKGFRFYVTSEALNSFYEGFYEEFILRFNISAC